VVEIVVIHTKPAKVIRKSKGFTSNPHQFPFKDTHLDSRLSPFGTRAICSCSVFLKTYGIHSKQVVGWCKLFLIVSEKIQMQSSMLRVTCCLIPG